MKKQKRSSALSAALLDKLADLLLTLRTRKEIISFLKAILTPKELIEIPKRLEIIRLLKRNLPQREVARILKVGVATVTRGARELKLGHFKDV